MCPLVIATDNQMDLNPALQAYYYFDHVMNSASHLCVSVSVISWDSMPFSFIKLLHSTQTEICNYIICFWNKRLVSMNNYFTTIRVAISSSTHRITLPAVYILTELPQTTANLALLTFTLKQGNGLIDYT
jgi:hypothetical protein